MQVYLPSPYPDELLYSIIARYLLRIGASFHGESSAASHIFGRRVTAQVLFPSSLDTVSKRTWSVWKLTGREIVYKMTVFPFYTMYLNNQRIKQCLHDLLTNDNNIRMHLGFGGRIRPLRELRFCNVCKTIDLRNYGETYWRRSHQLNGVVVCPEHGEILSTSKVLIQGNMYVDATNGTIESSPACGDLNEREIATARKVAIRCKELLTGLVEKWGREGLPLVYRNEGILRGFTENKYTFSPTQLENAFADFYSTTFLNALGCEIEMGSNKNWLRLAFRPSKNVLHPLQHALIQVFLENIKVRQPKTDLLMLGPWRCPNPYAKHKEKYPLRDCTFRTRKNGDRVASAKCSCGFCFTFTGTSDDDSLLPVVRTVVHWGPLWKEEALRLKRSGLNLISIAKKMSISRRSVQGILKMNSSAKEHRITDWRQKWAKLLDKVPGRSRTAARKKNPKLYGKLLRHDRDWLYSEPSSYKPLVSTRDLIDWSARDEELSMKLRNSAAKLREAIPVKRLTKSAIVGALERSYLINNNLERLPRCASVLSECIETLDAYRERRLIAAAKRIEK